MSGLTEQEDKEDEMGLYYSKGREDEATRVEEPSPGAAATESQQETSNHKDGGVESESAVNVHDIMSVLNDQDFDAHNLSTSDLKSLASNLFDHDKKVQAMTEKAVQVLCERLNRNEKCEK